MTEIEIQSLRQGMEVLTHDELFMGIMLQGKQICNLNSDTARLQGEAKVLRDLLSQALTVLETIDPDGDSADGLETLIDHIEAALKVKPCP